MLQDRIDGRKLKTGREDVRESSELMIVPYLRWYPQPLSDTHERMILRDWIGRKMLLDGRLQSVVRLHIVNRGGWRVITQVHWRQTSPIRCIHPDQEEVYF